MAKRIDRYKKAFAQALYLTPSDSNEEIWLESPEAINKFLTDLAKAAMKVADEEARQHREVKE